MKFFSIDSPLYQFMQRLWDILKLNIMWLLFCIPIVTIGGSTIAAFSVLLRMSEDQEGDVIKDFWKAFKENWKQGILIGLLPPICFEAVYLDFQIYNASENGSIGLLIMGCFSAYIFIFCLLYVFPLLARYDNTVINSIKNSFRIGMKFFGRTALLLVIIVIELLIIFWNGTTMFIGALIGPACIMFTISGVAMHIFRKIEEDPSSLRR